MNVVVVAPEQYQGAIAGDINRRRGMIVNMSRATRAARMIQANIPLANLFGYTSDLRKRDQRHGELHMEPSHYAAVREELADMPKPGDKDKK